MGALHTNDLMKVRTIITPEQQKAEKVAADALAEAKLLTLSAPPVAVAEKKVTEDSVLSEAIDDKAKKTPTRKAENMTPQKQRKLVLDQPDKITNEGKVEHIVREDGTRQLNDHDGSKQQKQDILLNEHPAGEIIIE
jgi:hypothetical protein